MPHGFWIGHVSVHDPEGYAEYVRRDTPVIERFGGRFLVRGGRSEAPEAPLRDRHVVIAFPDFDAARACFASDAYQDVASIRRQTAEADFVIAEGVADATLAPMIGEAPAGPLGYWAAHVRVTDRAAYAPYVAENDRILPGHGGRFLLRGGRAEVVEGDLPGRHVVIAFPSFDAAKACYASPGYQANLRRRLAASEGRLVIVEGVG